jgi:acyl-CoA synthetase (NDP forming)
VQLDLHGEQEVRRAYQALAAEFGTSLRQILVQPMISGGVEVLIGVAPEPVFGPLIVFGPGGVATGLLDGHTARLTPSPAPAQPK